MSEIVPSPRLQVIASQEVDGVEMGVLEDGTPFLTGRGLVKVTGIAAGTLDGWGEFVPERGARLRAGKMAELLAAQGFEGARFFEKAPFKGQEVNAYPDSVCMAFLEYYAFEAGERCTPEALTNYRVLARSSLREFIYRQTGYDPRNIVPIEWRHFHDRLLLNPVPVGYFSVFRQSADLIVSSIREGLIVDEHTVPDVSIGQIWGKYWSTSNLDNQYGERTRYPHVYPDYFPQAQANDRIAPWIYPVSALGEFSTWLYSEYIPRKFPSYLQRKVQQGALPVTAAELLLRAVQPIELPPANP